MHVCGGVGVWGGAHVYSGGLKKAGRGRAGDDKSAGACPLQAMRAAGQRRILTPPPKHTSDFPNPHQQRRLNLPRQPFRIRSGVTPGARTKGETTALGAPKGIFGPCLSTPLITNPPPTLKHPLAEKKHEGPTTWRGKGERIQPLAV